MVYWCKYFILRLFQHTPGTNPKSPNQQVSEFRNSPKAFGGDPGDAWVMRNQGMLWVLLDLYNHSIYSKIHTTYDYTRFFPVTFLDVLSGPCKG